MTRQIAIRSVARLGLAALILVPAAFAVETPHAHYATRPRFSISGKARRVLYPGAKPAVITLRLRNPNPLPIYVTRVTVATSARDFAHGCSRGAFRITQAVLPPRGVKIPLHGSVVLPARRAPTIRMLGPGNEDRCRGLKLTFRYTGRAHS